MSIRRKALPVSNRKTKKMNKKSVILSEIGRKKLKKALDKNPDGYNASEMAKQADIGRVAFAKIVGNKLGSQKEPLGVHYRKIEKLFELLNIDLEDADIQDSSATDAEIEASQANKAKTQKRKHNTVKNNLLTLTIIFFTLDYNDQARDFDFFLNSNYLGGAFLIQGIQKGGQRWLTNRLVKQHFVDDYETDKLISINADPSAKEIHIDEIWKKLGYKLEQLKKPTPEKCRQAAFERWKNGTLIIAIYTDNVYEKEQSFSEFIQEFWRPLEAQIRSWREEENKNIKSYLLLFLIDSDNNSSQWASQTFYSNNLTNWHPEQPIGLPEIDKLDKNSKPIYNWIKLNDSLFLECDENTKEPEKEQENVWEKIWKESDEGIPELVFEQICQRYGYNWSDIEETLKYKL